MFSLLRPSLSNSSPLSAQQHLFSVSIVYTADMKRWEKAEWREYRTFVLCLPVKTFRLYSECIKRQAHKFLNNICNVFAFILDNYTGFETRIGFFLNTPFSEMGHILYSYPVSTFFCSGERMDVFLSLFEVLQSV